MPNQQSHSGQHPLWQLMAAAAFMLITLLVWTIDTPSLWSEEKTADAKLESVSDSIQTTLENALTIQRTSIEQLKNRSADLQELQEAVQSELTAYQSQNTSHTSLLLSSHTRIEDLEHALYQNRLGIQVLRERAKKLQDMQEAAELELSQTTERIELSRLELTQINKSQVPPDQRLRLETDIQELSQLLKIKKQLLSGYLDSGRNLMTRIRAILKSQVEMSEKLTAQLDRIQKASLFARTDYWHQLARAEFQDDVIAVWHRIPSIFRAEAWKTQWHYIQRGGFTRWVFFGLLLALMGLLGRRLSAALKRAENAVEAPEGYYRHLALRLLRRSLPLLGLSLLLGIYSDVQLSLLSIGLGRFLYYIFLILLITRWGMDYLAYGISGPPTLLRTFVIQRLKRFFRIFRMMAVAMAFAMWVAGSNSPVSWMMRNLFGIILIIWAICFWRAMKPVLAEGLRLGQAAPNRQWLTVLMGWSYLVTGGTVLANLIGYDLMAGYWIKTWVYTVAVAFIGWISRSVINEWHHALQIKAASAEEGQHAASHHPISLSLILLIRFIWYSGMGASIIYIWDPSGFLILQLKRFFDVSITIGSLKLNIEGLFLAAIIVFLTHIIVRIGRTLLDERFLRKKALERGFKDSVLTISSYLIWGIGLMLALGALGVNTTSLAVVFGAVSIGIGFGLQNIFNNFISGLILLFERPIQVGDYIEIGGLWAEVKKINVRSTVVQTFDNAAVIIPNSDFISQRVTNWSFKDKRMRRNIEVGVAYGSNIELVQKTMLDIAKDIPQIYKFPRPDVIFIDHGPSALIFRLRIWVHLDDYYSISSQVRFEIDRRFRELGIEIAFPQADLHIRSLPDGFQLSGAKDEET
jgi:small-conductance mechanosensitive channel